MKINKESIIFYTYTIILHVIIVYVKCDWLVDCGECRCKWNSGKKTADCKNLTLSTIPKNLSSELQVLDLSYNNINQLDNNAFINADLTNLHKLFIRNCNLKNIQTDAFKGLEILIEIDLSNNLLKNLSYNIFIHLVKVRSIVLNNNKIDILQNGLFCNLKYLHKIELKNNRIHLIEINVFNNLPYLSQIFLNDNKLKFLRKEIFENLKRLASLSLDSNPWNCTCELQSFRDFVLKYNLYTPPTSCYYPIKLRGILWTDQNQPEAFACKPKILYPSRGASINTSKENVTLICRVHASPNTLIAWDYNKQMYSNNYQQARVHIQLLREDLYSDDININNNKDDNDKDKIKNNIDKEIDRDIFISRLTIIGAEKSDEGTYTCFAENPGGKDEVQMNLLVQKHTHQNLLFHNNLVIVICLMVLGLLSASIFLAMITCCIYKRFKAINQLPNNENNDSHLHRHHHSHLHDQKQNYVNGLNVVNDSYHHHNHNYHQQNGGETNYKSDIKQNGNLSDVSVTIKTLTDLNDTNNLYKENNSQGSLQKHQQGYDDYLQYEQTHEKQQQNQNQKIHQDNEQIQSRNSSKIHTPIPSEHHYSSEQLNHHGNGEYQPDLLPYIPQSISLGYAVNQVLSSYDGKQLLDHKQYPYHNLEHQEHQQQQQQQIRHHKEDQTIDDLQYVHSYVGDTFNNAISKYEGNTIRNRNCNNTFISDEYLHNGIGNVVDGTSSSIDNILMPVGKKIINPSTMIASSASTLVTYPTINHHHHHHYHPDKQTFQRLDDDDGAIKIYPEDLDSSTATTTTSTSSEIFLRRHPVVRNSSSLNFIYNLNGRREIL